MSSFDPEWNPARAPNGPITILLSTHDKRLIVLRNAIEIGRTDVVVEGKPIRGTQAYVLLEGILPERSVVVPERPALRWMSLAVPGATASSTDLRQAFETGNWPSLPDVARLVYDVLRPGTTVIVTDEPLQPGTGDITVLSSGNGSPN